MCSYSTQNKGKKDDFKKCRSGRQQRVREKTMGMGNSKTSGSKIAINGLRVHRSCIVRHSAVFLSIFVVVARWFE